MNQQPDAYEDDENQTIFLGPKRSFFLYHILHSPLSWIGLILVLFFNIEAWGVAVYNLLMGAPSIANGFEDFYFTVHENGAAWWGLLLMGFAVIGAWVRYKVTRFAIEGGVLIITRGYLTPNPFNLFVRRDNTVALNLIYDVDVNRNLFQYIFGGGDIALRTASSEVFYLEFMVDPHAVRSYLLEHSGIKNKPVIGVY